MKRCPTCNKTYEDALRFCQSDGTQLVEVVHESSVEMPPPPPAPIGDPFSTAESSSDPLKTMVAGPAHTGAISPPAGITENMPSEPASVEPSPFAKPNAPAPWSQTPKQDAPATRVDVSLGSPEEAPESEEPPTVFAAPAVTFGTPSNPPQSTIESNWTPPPAPVAGWGDQGLGSGTPFQPPVPSGQQEKTLAIISLVCGILSLVCCGMFTGIPAIITGYIARTRAKTDPVAYGGSGMAMAGIILGALSIVFTIVFVIFEVFLGVMGQMTR